MAKETKNQKIRAFYTIEQRTKPTKRLTRHFIHSEASGGFWAYIRDLSQRERMSNEAIGQQTAVRIVIGFNQKVLTFWERLTIIDERGNTYIIKEKPDEYDYSKKDIKITGYAFNDGNVYEGEDEYD